MTAGPHVKTAEEAAAAFAEILTGTLTQLTSGGLAAQLEPAAAAEPDTGPPGPRPPRPDLSQASGANAGHPPMTPGQLFAEALHGAGLSRPMWTELANPLTDRL